MFVSAWAVPLQAPPLGNSEAALSTNSNSQIKNGDLIVNAFAAFMDSLFQKKLGIGRVPSIYSTLDVNPTITLTDSLKNIQSGITFNGSTMANYYGTYIAAPLGAGVITNKYALVTEPTAGKVGIGTITPASALSVAGGIQVADDTGACTTAKAGTLRWHAGNIEVCSGSDTVVNLTSTSNACVAPGTTIQFIVSISGSQFYQAYLDRDSNADGIYGHEPDQEWRTPGVYTVNYTISSDPAYSRVFVVKLVVNEVVREIKSINVFPNCSSYNNVGFDGYANVTTTVGSCVEPGSTIPFTVVTTAPGTQSVYLEKDTNADKVFGAESNATWTAPGTYTVNSPVNSDPAYSNMYAVRLRVGESAHPYYLRHTKYISVSNSCNGAAWIPLENTSPCLATPVCAAGPVNSYCSTHVSSSVSYPGPCPAATISKCTNGVWSPTPLTNASCSIGAFAGCTNPLASNYEPAATVDNGTCAPIDGCMNSSACNYDSDATSPSSCTFVGDSCESGTNNCNESNGGSVGSDCSCNASTPEDHEIACTFGCTDSGANNYNSGANTDDGSCTYDATCANTPCSGDFVCDDSGGSPSCGCPEGSYNLYADQCEADDYCPWWGMDQYGNPC